jgi:hypothetical protein
VSILARLQALERQGSPDIPQGTLEWHHPGDDSRPANCDRHERCHMTSSPIPEPLRFMRIVEEG